MEEDNNFIREGMPRDINPNELDNVHPAKDLKSQDKIGIKESELGREKGQSPADEQFESTMSQIDEETVRLNEEKHGQTATNLTGEIPLKEEDNRDEGDSKNDWNAENNDSGRRK